MLNYLLHLEHGKNHLRKMIYNISLKKLHYTIKVYSQKREQFLVT